MTETAKKASPWLRNVIAVSVIVIVIFNTIVILQANRAYEEALMEAAAKSYRLAGAMEQEIELTLFGADITLSRAVDKEYFGTLFKSGPPDELKRSMERWIMDSPQFSAIALVDERGQATLYSAKTDYLDWVDYDHLSFADNEIFAKLRAGLDTDYAIGILPARGHPGGFLLAARRITHVDGSFGGAFIMMLDPEIFIRYFNSLDMGRRNYISLQAFGASKPLFENSRQKAVYTEINRRVLEAIQKDHREDIVVGTHDNSEGPDEFYAFQPLGRLPLAVTVVLNEEDYLKVWRQTRLYDLELLSIFLILCAMIARFAFAMTGQITKGQKLEAAAMYASQAKTDFLASMSHELRTPLNAIIGYAEMIRLGYFGPLLPKLDERLQDIHLCGGHLLQLITDILEFSKGSEGKLELLEEKTRLQEIVDEVVRIMNDRIKAKQISITVDVEEKLPLLVADKRKIRQILFNLLSNSLKFTPEGGAIRIAVQQDMNNSQVIIVSDTGIGIAKKDISLALSVFGQAHRDTKHEGSGLGLPLCKMFAELHGGDLALESAYGQGTTVKVSFSASRNC